MRVQLSSNVLSGVYTCFEMLAAVALSCSITTFVRCWNLKRIYDDKKKLHLVPCRLQLISNHGLTSRNLHIAAVLVFSIVSLLLAIGGFSMVGVTVQNKQQVRVPYLVKRAAPDYVLDVINHISLDRGKISGELALLRQLTRCLKVNVATMTIYQYIYNASDLTAINRDPRKEVEVTCLETHSGYKSEVALRRNQTKFLPLELIGCRWNINSEELGYRTLSNPNVTLSSECEGQIQEAWCFWNKDVFCAGIVRYTDWVGVSIYFGSNAPQPVLRTRIDRNDGIGSEKLKAMVLMMASGISKAPSTLVIMLSLFVQRNQTVTRIVGNRQETKIETTLLLATILPALGIIFVVFSTTFVMWIKVLVLPGRLKYNRFNTAMELLSCAAAEKFSDSKYRPFCRKRIAVEIEAEGNDASPIEDNFENTR